MAPQQQHTAHPVAVVTGASSGIGRELAKVFAQHGYDVLICAEDDGIHTAAAELRALGAGVEAVRADLSTAYGVDRLYDRIRHAGAVEAVAINAGVGVGGAFVETDLDEELRLLNLNVVGVVRLAKHVLKDMVARDQGRILFTSSIAAEMPAPFLAVYGASKAFVQSFAEALRNEVKDTNVVITALQPGPTDTHFFERAHMEDTRVAASKKADPAEVARQGFEALMKGKDHVVTGAKNKVQSALAQVLPETMTAEMHRRQTEPGSADR
jgi:short-subunit dehydrogenase